MQHGHSPGIAFAVAAPEERARSDHFFSSLHYAKKSPPLHVRTLLTSSLKIGSRH